MGLLTAGSSCWGGGGMLDIKREQKKRRTLHICPLPLPVPILPYPSALFHVVVIRHWCSAVLLVVVKGGQGCGMAGGGRRR